VQGASCGGSSAYLVLPVVLQLPVVQHLGGVPRLVGGGGILVLLLVLLRQLLPALHNDGVAGVHIHVGLLGEQLDAVAP